MSPTSAFSVPRRIVFITNVNLDWVSAAARKGSVHAASADGSAASQTEDQLRGSVYQHTSVHVNRMQRVMEGYFLDCDSSAVGVSRQSSSGIPSRRTLTPYVWRRTQGQSPRA